MSSGLIDTLKKYSVSALTKELEKKVNDIYEINNDEYQLNLITNKLLKNNQYETYIYMTDKKDSSFMILYKLFYDEKSSSDYFNNLKNILINKGVEGLVDLCITQK